MDQRSIFDTKIEAETVAVRIPCERAAAFRLVDVETGDVFGVTDDGHVLNAQLPAGQSVRAGLLNVAVRKAYITGRGFQGAEAECRGLDYALRALGLTS